MAATTIKNSFPLNMMNLCNGEIVIGILEQHLIINVVQDTNGGFHSTFHNILQYKGTGTTTNSVYIGKSESNSSSNSKTPFPQEFTLVSTLFLRSKDNQVPDFYSHLTQHITMNANGDITSSVFNARTECK